MTIPFIGRKHELQLLHDFQKKGAASLVVVYGRRRIGKSRLIEEFGKNKSFMPFQVFFLKKNNGPGSAQ